MKRKLPFDPTPQKVLPVANNENVANRKPSVAFAAGVGKPQVAAKKGAPEESFALNFSTFIDPKKPTTLDLTVSPASFDLSYEMPPSSEDDDGEVEEVSMAAGGITATTFVLENKVHEVNEPTGKLLEAIKQREESETQLKEVEAEVRRLRETLDSQYVPSAPSIDVVKPVLPTIAAHNVQNKDKPLLLSRLATEELIQHARAPTELRTAHSTTDMKLMRNRVGLDDEAKRARLNTLRALGTSTGVSVSKHGESILPAHHPIDAADPRARMKSRPQKLKMLRAVSKLEPADVQLSTSTLEAGLSGASPSTVVAATNRKGVPAANPLATLKWAGDGSSSASASHEEEEEAPAPAATTAALFRKIEPTAETTIRVPLAEESHDSEEQSESMDERMVDQTLEQSAMPHQEEELVRHSIFVAPPPTVAALAAPISAAPKMLLDVNLDQAASLQAASQALEQLDFVTKDSKLFGLFGEHLKGEREDAMLRILDDIHEYQSIKAGSERLSLARSIFQMYLSDSAARENTISKATISDELRLQIKAKIRAEQCDTDLFVPIENAVKIYLATREIPKFVKCDLYRTLGFKKVKAKKKPLAHAAFEQQPAPQTGVSVAVAPVAVVPAPVKAVVEEEVDEEEESSDASPAPKQVKPFAAAEAKPAIATAVAVPVVVAAVSKPAAISKPEVAKTVEKVAAVPKPVQQKPSVKVDVPVESKPVVVSQAVAKDEELNATIDSLLTDPKELEQFLSFVESSDKKAAQRTGANVVFLQKVAQFNKAEPLDRPKV